MKGHIILGSEGNTKTMTVDEFNSGTWYEGKETEVLGTIVLDAITSNLSVEELEEVFNKEWNESTK